STIAHAIIDAYSMASIKERSPEVHLFLEMPPDQVDVNVHPTKAEVRFRDQSMVHEVVRRGLMDALGAGGVPQLQLRPEIASITPTAVAIPGVLNGGTYPNRWLPNVGSGGSIVGSGFSRTDVSDAIRMKPDPTDGLDQTSDIRPMIPLGQFR